MVNNLQNNQSKKGSFEKKNEQKKKDNKQFVQNFFKELNFQSKWITEGADRDMVVFADKCGKYMAHDLTKSQIRNVFGEIKRIQLKGFDEAKSAFVLLKPKVAYAEGRNKTSGMMLFKMIFDSGWNCVEDDESRYHNFCNLLEAILAYHKAYGGKD